MICEHKNPDWTKCKDCHVEVYQFVKHEEDRVPLISCNLCGESCRLIEGIDPRKDPDDEFEGYNNGLVNAVVTGTYNSTPGNGTGALDDLSSYSFDLCEYCCDWLFTVFRNPPDVACAVHGGDDCNTWLPAAARVEKYNPKGKDLFLAEKARRDALRMVK